MSYLDDPRVLFAAERALLAWQRTAISLMGFGFVVERFGLFLRIVTNQPLSNAQQGVSACLKVLQHQHIAIVRREQTYLRLTQPETKRHSQPMITMPRAVDVYERLLARRMSVGPIRPSDHVFFPEWPDRQYAIVQMRRQFDLVLKRAGLKQSGRGENRTLYCLRHTAIMERLLNGDKIDVLSLARNSRTSVEMIERFYARHLHGEMVVAKLQSSFVFVEQSGAGC